MEENQCIRCANPGVLTKDREIFHLHGEGMPAVEIGARLDIAPDLVRYRLRRAGLEPAHAAKFFEAEEHRRDIFRLHQEGLSPKRIAGRLGLDASIVYRRLREAKIEPHPNPEQVRNTLEGLDEIVALGKEGMPRYEIAKRTGSTWPLVAEVLEKTSVKPAASACDELADWASTLVPLIEEIKQAHPNTEPILSKVTKLGQELTAITDAVSTAQSRLPWRGTEADRERWCLADIGYSATQGLGVIDALRGCVDSLDTEELPKLLEQARTCVRNITGIMGGALEEATEAPKEHLETDTFRV